MNPHTVTTQGTDNLGNQVMRLSFNYSVITDNSAAAGNSANYSVVSLVTINLGAISGISGIRAPDFYSFNVSVGIPATSNFVGWNTSISFDRYGTMYVSPFGVSVGKSPDGVSFSLTANWLLQNRAATPAEDYIFLSGLGVNAGAGYGLGGGMFWSPGNGFAAGVGVYSPQLGISANYTPDYLILHGDGITW